MHPPFTDIAPCLIFAFIKLDRPCLSLSASSSLTSSTISHTYTYSAFFICYSRVMFGRACWASARAIMRTVKQHQMNRREKCMKKGVQDGETDKDRESNEYEVLGLVWLLNICLLVWTKFIFFEHYMCVYIKMKTHWESLGSWCCWKAFQKILEGSQILEATLISSARQPFLLHTDLKRWIFLTEPMCYCKLKCFHNIL